MSKSIKFKNNNYLDSSGIMHNRELLSSILAKCAMLPNTPQTPYGNTQITYLQLMYNNGWKLYIKAITDGTEMEFTADLTPI